MKFIRLMLIVFSIGFSTNSKAVVVFGEISCGKWDKTSTAKFGTDEAWDKIAHRIWLTGFLSGAAFSSNIDVLKNTDAESVYLWMDNYCRSHSLDTVTAGANALLIELTKRMKK